ncbi:MAG TPA: hypothetical protein VGE23_01160 [Candidatus Paceibacterota bacterium]
METPNLGYVGVFDVDGTLYTKDMAENRHAPEALAAAQFVREFFDQNGTFMVASAQTAEMLMSSEVYETSVRNGFTRLRPLLGGTRGKRFYVKPETLATRVPFTDPKAIMSMGTGCHFLEPDEWYREHRTYKRRLGINWRANALSLLRHIRDPLQEDFERYLALIESEDNYRAGKTDVMPLEYRIQFEFKDRVTKDRVKKEIQDALLGLRTIMEVAKSDPGARGSLVEEFGDILLNLRIVDESDEANDKFQFYLMPRYASKEEMVDETLSVLSRGEMIEDLLIAGDMPPDLRAGCYAGRALRATFLLVGGSPLAPYLSRDDPRFGLEHAGESLRFITDNLSPTGRPGFEMLERAGVPMRLFVNGAVAYPGLVGPETIAAFLKDPRKPVLY